MKLTSKSLSDMLAGAVNQRLSVHKKKTPLKPLPKLPEQKIRTALAKVARDNTKAAIARAFYGKIIDNTYSFEPHAHPVTDEFLGWNLFGDDGYVIAFITESDISKYQG